MKTFIINKTNFSEILSIILDKLNNWQEIKVLIDENDKSDNWETVVDFWDWVDANEVLDFLEKNGRKVEEATA